MQLQKNKPRLADTHTHILPRIDDGANNTDESLKLLLSQSSQGVTDVVLTPHFKLSEIEIEKFIRLRNTSFNLLKERIIENELLKDMKFHLGAEVRYDPNLIYTDIYKLCIENTSYLLLELSATYPFNFEKTIGWMLSQGVTPIIAHVERYEYLTSNAKLLANLCEQGVVFQFNASSVFSHHYFRLAKKMLKKGFIHLIASDAHDMEKRPPQLKMALDKLKKYSGLLTENSIKVVTDKLI
jgi:protein-tyrosine phosphatase